LKRDCWCIIFFDFTNYLRGAMHLRALLRAGVIFGMGCDERLLMVHAGASFSELVLSVFKPRNAAGQTESASFVH
jgi:hypothetical protein